MHGRSQKFARLGDRPIIAEIGGGYGGLAVKLKRLFPAATILIFDLPEANAIQTWYLDQNFPDAKTSGYSDLLRHGLPAILEARPDFIMLPGWSFADLQPASLDLVVNTRSMMEMNRETIAFYFNGIHRALKPESMFYCVNRYSKSTSGETIRIKDDPFDDAWSVVQARRPGSALDHELPWFGLTRELYAAAAASAGFAALSMEGYRPARAFVAGAESARDRRPSEHQSGNSRRDTEYVAPCPASHRQLRAGAPVVAQDGPAVFVRAHPVRNDVAAMTERRAAVQSRKDAEAERINYALAHMADNKAYRYAAERAGGDPDGRLLEAHRERFRRYRAGWRGQPRRAIDENLTGEAFASSGMQPLCVDIEVAAVCDLACPFCFRQYIATPDKIISGKLYRRLIEECGKLQVPSIKLNWRGEPLLHPKIAEFIDLAKRAGVLEVMINTNATRLDEKMSRNLIEAGLDQIIYSFDGGSKKPTRKCGSAVSATTRLRMSTATSAALPKSAAPWARNSRAPRSR